MKPLIKVSASALIIAGSLTQVQASTVLKLAHAAPDSDTQQAAAERFAELVDERTNGDITINIFGNGLLGGDQQMIAAVRNGLIDIELSGNPNFTGLEPALGAFDLPYIFANREEAYQVLDGDIGQRALNLLTDKNLKGLAFWEVGFRAMTNSKRPIKTPEDVRGLVMRTNSNESLIEAFSLLGANPVPMPIGELYTALETGTVDAQDHPVGIVWSAGFHEVQDYLSLTNQAYTSLIMVMNQEKFDSLSPEHQEILLTSARDAGNYQRELNIESEQEILNEMRANGVQIEEEVDTSAFQTIVLPTWDSYINNNGSEWTDAIQEVLQ
ncbi:2,3-diketo-L-gulonate-binding periplasmic protein yiaO precursor [Halomonas citrativorans]|uniref:2,3-diketo-L-gulonate-binding periplasmic protein yiaO n=1 Tax=Halomonas citrativorans TaxID=2742612 RepID=A0A1R4I4Z0_9GAMM|nr:DctP family TRAP transporter solute-binding subunit [Halomonas citrativorans]SJN14766.1 2,3-diketo-L-gulonate-binding periplasmic protein yiaO precursor [Halomonas citrativorans]